ncbi:MAG TPA: DUF4136 domain-containing protein [Chryseosolibacter sp.]
MKNYLFILAAALAFIGCRPEPEAVELVDQMVISTNYDNTANFGSYSTYAIPTDTIGFISETSNDTIIVASRSSFPRPVLQTINSELQARGFARVNKNSNPDLGINVLVVNDFNVFQDVYYPNNYYGGYYGGYYGYNSWYSYPYVRTYAYNTGVLIIEVVDLKNLTPDNKVKVLWTAYMGDVYSTLDLEAQAKDAIVQAFTQSPYLTR